MVISSTKVTWGYYDDLEDLDEILDFETESN
jgi:hypothetical protein